jgi:hypothetical protein
MRADSIRAWETPVDEVWENDLSWYLAGRPWASANVSLIS